MGDYTDMEDIFKAQRRIASRSGWGKVLVGALVSAALSIVGTALKTRADLAKVESALAAQKKDLDFLKDHMPQVEQAAIEARGDAQRVERLLFAHLGGYQPNGVK